MNWWDQIKVSTTWLISKLGLFSGLFEEFEFTTNVKGSMQVSHARQTYKSFPHPICTPVFFHHHLICHHSINASNRPKIWAILKKIQTVGLRIWNFQEYQRSSMQNFQGSIKNKMEFPEVTKKKSCGIFRGLAFWLWNFQLM